jgi:tetratricopeptide (TPR) repeat protein
MDEAHSYDFLMYAYLQSGQDGNARVVLKKTVSVIDGIAAMPDMGRGFMYGMVGYYRTKFPVFYALEMRDWRAAAALKPEPGAPPEDAIMTWWARAIADGHLHRAQQAQADVAQYDALMIEVKKGPEAYLADSTGARIERSEMSAWASYAAGQQDEALKAMREAADLQDKVGQREVDIPAREMLADMLLDLNRPQQALAEYRMALRLSPNRFNGLYNAGLAAEETGDKTAAQEYYAALLKSTGDGAQSARPELTHARSFVGSERVVASQGNGR